MKNYVVSKKQYLSSKEFIITNQDDNPKIQSIACSFFEYKPIGSLVIVKLTLETFHSLPTLMQNISCIPDIDCDEVRGTIGLFNQQSMANIVKLFEYLQKIDPLPYKLFKEIEQYLPFNFATLIIKELVENNQYADALERALADTVKGDMDILNELANCHQRNNNQDEYLKTLYAFPKSHPEYLSAQKNIFYCLSTKPLPDKETPEECIKRQEELFLIAFNSNCDEASNYYDLLREGSGLNAPIDFKNDPGKIFIALAREYRQMKQQIKDLQNPKEEESRYTPNLFALRK